MEVSSLVSTPRTTVRRRLMRCVSMAACLLILSTSGAVADDGASGTLADAARMEAPRPAVPVSKLRGEEIQRALPQGKLVNLDPAILPPLELVPKHFVVDGDSVEAKATLAQETFETFPSAAWQVFSQSSTDAFWGRSSRRSSQGSFSAWCAGAGNDAPSPGQNVPDGMESWMVTGPFNLSSLSEGELAFDLWLENEEGFDFFGVGASINGTNYTVLTLDQDTTGWQRFTVDLTQWGSLGDLTGRSQVWFSFLYVTDGSITFEGAYVDNAVLSSGGASSGLNVVINQIDGSSCPRMQAFVVVNDGQGNPITGLTEQNFTLGENGVDLPVDSQPAAGSGENLATTLVLDGSASLNNTDVQNIKDASNDYIDLLAADDQVAVYFFGTLVVRLQDYTTDKDAAKGVIDLLDDNLGNTSLYDAIIDASNYSTTVGGRRALLVMTDGEDTASSASIDDAIAAAVAAGVPVYTIGFGNVDEQVLQRIADETGGVFFLGVDSGDLQTILQRIGNQLASQYLLEWDADTIDGGTQSVTVGVSFQGQTASRTSSYSQAGTPCASGLLCVPNDTTLCLNQDRFRVRVSWTDFQGNRGPGRTVQGCASDDSGLLWFFGPENWEMLMKVLDGCGLNDHYWVFFAATTNVAYEVTVTDTLTGAQKVYTNPLGNAAPSVTDTSAFDCP